MTAESRQQASQWLGELEDYWDDAPRTQSTVSSLITLLGTLSDPCATPSKAALDVVAQWLRDLQE